MIYKIYILYIPYIFSHHSQPSVPYSTNEARPGDIFHPDFERGLPTYFDLTVRSSLQPSYLVKTASCPGAAAEAGEIEKDQQHDWMVSQTGSVFHPLVVETLGLWSPNSLEVIKVIARRASFHNNASISNLYAICTSNFQSSCGFLMHKCCWLD